jgi:hypothetical protein
MYYPSRIRQLADAPEGVDTGQLAEVTRYYRDLYGMLSEQANRQVEQVMLHVGHLELFGQPVLGDEHLLRYLFQLLGPAAVEARAKDHSYVEFSVAARPKTTFDYLLCRQIVRDHGEATNRRACGITTEENQLTVILPRYNGKI